MIEDQSFRTIRGFANYATLRQDLAGTPLDHLWSAGRPLQEARGRGGACVVDLESQNGRVVGVARDYLRGGALAFLFPRSYLDRYRAERELSVLAALRRRGVPVVEPVAALSRRQWIFCHRLRLITVLLENALPLPAFVADHPDLRRAAIREAGRVVQLAMTAGLIHRDLHPDNLVARVDDCKPDGVAVYLLDLDRAELRSQLTTPDRDRMLVRMARYLRRHADELRVRPAAPDQVRFLAGMGLSREERKAAFARIRPLLETQLARRGLS